MIESVKRSAAFRALGDADRLVLLTLLDIADAPRLASPRIVHGFARRDAIAERVGKSISSVGRSLRNLRASGWIMTATREPVRANLGLVFSVFPAPHAAVVDFHSVPKGQHLLRKDGSSRNYSPDPAPPAGDDPRPPAGDDPRPPASAEVTSPYYPWPEPTTKPTPPNPPAPAGGGAVVVVDGARRTSAAPEPTPRTHSPRTLSGAAAPEPTPSEPCPVQHDAVVSVLQELRVKPNVARELASLPVITDAGVHAPARIRATYQQVRSARSPIGALVVRLRAGDLAVLPPPKVNLDAPTKIDTEGVLVGEDRRAAIAACRAAARAGAPPAA